MKPQHILAVDSNSIVVCRSHGTDSAEIHSLYPIDNEDLVVIQRERAENDYNYRHLIPYVVVTNKVGQVLVYERGAGVGEKRLSGQRSIGFGGHVDLADIRYKNSVIDLDKTIMGACLRELNEELGVLPGELVIESRGNIIDNTNDVGLVHLGLFYVATYTGAYSKVKIKEKELALIGWMNIESIDAESLEPWSQAVLREICPIKANVIDIDKFVMNSNNESVCREYVFTPEGTVKQSLWCRFQNWLGAAF